MFAPFLERCLICWIILYLTVFANDFFSKFDEVRGLWDPLKPPPPCSIVFIPRKQSPFQPLITKSYRSCSGSSLFICLTFCSENHVKLTKGNISFLKLCLIWIVTSFWTGSIHLLQFPFLSWNWLYPGKSLLPQKTLLFGDFLF